MRIPQIPRPEGMSDEAYSRMVYNSMEGWQRQGINRPAPRDLLELSVEDIYYRDDYLSER